MIRCTFESGTAATLRHVVLHAVVEKDGALLLVRRAERLTEGGKWGLPGGFLDRDETLELLGQLEAGHLARAPGGDRLGG